jgi:hypothetical protein
MDPQDGLIQLMRLALLRFEAEGEEVFLQEATASQLRALKESRSRGPAVVAAKKGLKIYEDLAKLAEALDIVEESDPGKLRRSRPKVAAKGKSSTGVVEGSLERAIVPFVPKIESVRIDTAPLSRKNKFSGAVWSPEMRAALKPLKKGENILRTTSKNNNSSNNNTNTNTKNQHQQQNQ